jgi:hypothetical protein
MINKKRIEPGSEMFNIKNMGCGFFFYSFTLSPLFLWLFFYGARSVVMVVAHL